MFSRPLWADRGTEKRVTHHRGQALKPVWFLRWIELQIGNGVNQPRRAALARTADGGCPYMASAFPFDYSDAQLRNEMLLEVALQVRKDASMESLRPKRTM